MNKLIENMSDKIQRGWYDESTIDFLKDALPSAGIYNTDEKESVGKSARRLVVRTIWAYLSSFQK